MAEMNPQVWQKVCQAFDRALELCGEARQSYLKLLHANDQLLFQEVTKLLKQAEASIADLPAELPDSVWQKLGHPSPADSATSVKKSDSTIVSCDNLLSVLRKHQLCSGKKLNSIKVGTKTDPTLLAKEMVKKGWLTPFQINRIFLGRHAELRIGPYVIQERIGEGGFGEVFRGFHPLMDRTVAIKVIRPERLKSKDNLKRFLREIKATAKLSHPNVVLAYDAGQVGNSIYYVMEYIEGMNLADYISKNGPVPYSTAAELIRQAALGLQHAHDNGLVHRDVKPQNLIWPSNQPTVKLLDLGLARMRVVPKEEWTVLTHKGVIMGSPDFMAPEQALDSASANAQADIYSLGCTFYYLLTGRSPCPAATVSEKLSMHISGTWAKVNELRPDLPEPIVEIVHRMMATSAKDRYASIAEVIKALNPHCQPLQKDADESTGTWTGKPEVAQPRPLARTWLLGLGGVLVLAAMVLTLGLVMSFAWSPSKQDKKDGKDSAEPKLPNPKIRWVQRNESALDAAATAFKKENTKFARARPTAQFLRIVLDVVSPDGEPNGVNKGDLLMIGRGEQGQSDGSISFDDFDQLTVGMSSVSKEVFHQLVNNFLLAKQKSVAIADLMTKLEKMNVLTEFGSENKKNVAAIEPTATLNHPSNKWHNTDIQDAVFSADGKHAISCGRDRRLIVWDVTTKRSINAWENMPPETESFNSLAISEKNHLILGVGGVREETDGKSILTGGKHFVMPLFDLSPKHWNLLPKYWIDPQLWGNRLWLDDHTSLVHGVALSADGSVALSGGSDGRLRRWKIDWKKNSVEEPSIVHNHQTTIRGAAMSADGNVLGAADHNGFVKFFRWDLKDQRVDFPELAGKPAHDGPVEAIAISRDGKIAASGGTDGMVIVYDLDNHKIIRKFVIPDYKGKDVSISSIALSPNGERLLVGGGDIGTAENGALFYKSHGPYDIYEYGKDSDMQRVLRGHDRRILSIRFSRDGQRVLSCGNDNRLCLWQLSK